jgi:hypothetical protein
LSLVRVIVGLCEGDLVLRLCDGLAVVGGVGPLTSSLLTEFSRVNSFEGVEVSATLSGGPWVGSLVVGAEDGLSVGSPLVGATVGLCEGDIVLGRCDGLAVVGGVDGAMVLGTSLGLDEGG